MPFSTTVLNTMEKETHIVELFWGNATISDFFEVNSRKLSVAVCLFHDLCLVFALNVQKNFDRYNHYVCRFACRNVGITA